MEADLLTPSGAVPSIEPVTVDARSVPMSEPARLKIHPAPARAVRTAVAVLSEWIGIEHVRLGGGTALEARWHHRTSTDLEFFALGRHALTTSSGHPPKICRTPRSVPSCTCYSLVYSNLALRPQAVAVPVGELAERPFGLRLDDEMAFPGAAADCLQFRIGGEPGRDVGIDALDDESGPAQRQRRRAAFDVARGS